MKAAIILLALQALPVFKEDRPQHEAKSRQLELIAANLSMVRLSTPALAFTIAWGGHETHYSLRVNLGICRRWECPSGARGPWQNEHTAVTDGHWDQLVGFENIGWQVERAAYFANWSMGACGDDARCAFRLVAGLRGDCPLRDEDARIATYTATLERLR